ncbi:Hypothetical predicted protein [Mytilus galloprovincialis]|uniref:Uncharacterized protein n=1 Tax=Mytilus galloprovincialis TaxID=29158 RepID=A0A8B6CQD3_MYTGA|nr:Hypothetical predicted protein [Mytilus galloprovincialis]
MACKEVPDNDSIQQPDMAKRKEKIKIKQTTKLGKTTAPGQITPRPTTSSQTPTVDAKTTTINHVLDKSEPLNHVNYNVADTMKTAMTAFWVGCGHVFVMFAVVSTLKLVLQMKKKNPYLPIQRPMDTTTTTADSSIYFISILAFKS